MNRASDGAKKTYEPHLSLTPLTLVHFCWLHLLPPVASHCLPRSPYFEFTNWTNQPIPLGGRGQLFCRSHENCFLCPGSKVTQLLFRGKSDNLKGGTSRSRPSDFLVAWAKKCFISTVRCSIPPTTRIPSNPSNPSNPIPLIGLGVLNHSNAIEIN